MLSTTEEYKDRIFRISSQHEFDELAMWAFDHQIKHCEVYQQYCQFLKTGAVKRIEEIPFLPIEFFKSKKISDGGLIQLEFSSSGTTGTKVSKHFVQDIKLYEQSFIRAFEAEYGPIAEWTILCLLPSYLERSGSSLVYMAEKLVTLSNKTESGFYLHNLEELSIKLKELKEHKGKTLLLGVSFALIDMAEQYPMDFPNLVIMETGGMKGKREELTREELHEIIKNGFNVEQVHSEYGMTELLSQAYAKKDGIYDCPPWMQAHIRDINDPFGYMPVGKTGALNVIDLANIHSCSFIATQDLARKSEDGSFEVLGRFDNSEIRGCNLMYF